MKRFNALTKPRVKKYYYSKEQERADIYLDYLSVIDGVDNNKILIFDDEFIAYYCRQFNKVYFILDIYKIFLIKNVLESVKNEVQQEQFIKKIWKAKGKDLLKLQEAKTFSYDVEVFNYNTLILRKVKINMNQLYNFIYYYRYQTSLDVLLEYIKVNFGLYN